jgi:hypothetical protein
VGSRLLLLGCVREQLFLRYAELLAHGVVEAFKICGLKHNFAGPKTITLPHDLLQVVDLAWKPAVAGGGSQTINLPELQCGRRLPKRLI